MKMNYRKWCFVIRGSTLLIGIFLFIGIVMGEKQEKLVSTIFWIIGIFFFIIIFIISIWKLRCPECGKRVPDLFPIIKYRSCPHCHAKLY